MYIGSSKDIKTRWSNHKHFLKGRGKERDTHKNIYLQKEWNEFGEDSFQFLILEKCDETKLIEREQYWIKSTNSDLLYNITDAIYDSLPEEMRKRISLGRIGIKFSEEHKQNLSNAHRGTKWSEKQKLAHIGKHNNKLTYEIACEIREIYRRGEITQKKLAEMYSVSSRTIFDIIHNKYHAERGMTQ